MFKHCQQSGIIIPNKTIEKVSLGPKDVCCSSNNITTFDYHFSFFKEDIFYFFVERYSCKSIDPFFKKTASLFFHEEKVKIIGDLQMPTPKERDFFLENKLEEMVQSCRVYGKIVVFVPEKYYTCTHIL